MIVNWLIVNIKKLTEPTVSGALEGLSSDSALVRVQRMSQVATGVETKPKTEMETPPSRA